MRLFLRNLYGHSRLDLRTGQSVEVHDVLSADTRVLLGDAVEGVSALDGVGRILSAL